MTAETASLSMACVAIAHYVVAMVMFVFARHQVRYLAIAWIMAIFAFFATYCFFFIDFGGIPQNILHPIALVTLVCICYLQSIYPLSFVMPGYLQWGRMWKYASPIVAVFVLFALSFLFEGRPEPITTAADFRRHLLSFDMLMRLYTVGLSIMYIANIFRLPHTLAKVEFPRYLIAYSSVLGFSAVFYLVICVLSFTPTLITIYAIIFTALNLYLCMRTLETMASRLPQPVIKAVLEEPTEKDIEKAGKDFNALNQQRFARTEYWMQHHVEDWKDNTFGRDRLCSETGINRHLMLQCVRSQGYNNVHDYISRYRIDELKRMILSGEVSTLTECQLAGFGTIKTVRSCFLKCEGVRIEDYLATNARNTAEANA